MAKQTEEEILALHISVKEREVETLQKKITRAEGIIATASPALRLAQARLEHLRATPLASTLTVAPEPEQAEAPEQTERPVEEAWA